MFQQLQTANERPAVFGYNTVDALWADAYRARHMLAFHLNETLDLASRNHEFIDRSANWFAERFQLDAGKAVCDFGCGPALYTSRFAATGARVTGVDISHSSLRHARDHAERDGLSINYVQANYLEFAPAERFDLVTLIMCDFCALSRPQRRTLLAKVHECLRDDGALVLDVYSMAAFEAREEVSSYERNQLDHFWCEEEYYCFVNTFKYDAEAVVLDKYSIFTESGRQETVYNWLQYFSPDSLASELAESGFAAANSYQDVCGQPFSAQHPEFAVVAKKR